MSKAILKISKVTDRFNGYGMPIIEVVSDSPIKVINRGYNEFEAVTEIDETDLLRLRTYFNTFSTETVHLEIACPDRTTCAWYKLTQLFLGDNRTCIMW